MCRAHFAALRIHNQTEVARSLRGGLSPTVVLSGQPQMVRSQLVKSRLAEAYGADPEFFAFYRSMQAYENAFKGETRALISPKSDFFRYFSSPTVTPGSAEPAAKVN